jgi:hypothetical protein
MPDLDFQSLMAQFWQLQVPMTLVPDPTGQGVLGMASYGERVHFQTQDQVNFFLLGYRLGTQKAQEVTPPPWMMPSQEEQS